jgi:AbrB family looped-hinge helix DNA binding protein
VASVDIVTVSPKYQVLIPARIREELRIRPGDRMAVIVKHGILHYVPIRPFAHTEGMTPGLDLSDLRDERDGG